MTISPSPAAAALPGRQVDLTHTSWTLVERVRAGGTDSSAALEALCTFLYQPVHAAVRAMVGDEHETQDITQRFFVDVLLWRGLIERADQSKGRLRTLVLEAARNFVRDACRRAKVRRAVDGARTLEEDRHAEATGDADTAFESAWFDALCAEACRRCETHFRTGGLAGHWTLFERARLLPATREIERPGSLAQIMREHGFGTINQARGAIDTVAKRLRVLLAEVACETSIGETDREEQLEGLRSRGVRV